MIYVTPINPHGCNHSPIGWTIIFSVSCKTLTAVDLSIKPHSIAQTSVMLLYSSFYDFKRYVGLLFLVISDQIASMLFDVNL